jgi:endonuclease/exonuclease/phosphatase family metal-dependent hydrolase
LGLDGVRSIRRIADVLLPLNPDVVCLQEVDQRMHRSWLANQPKYLSVRLGMQAFFQRNLKEGIGWFGNCILIKPDALHCRNHPLPGSGEPRGLMEVTGKMDGSEIVFFCTHLSTEVNVREVQAEKVAEVLRGVRGPKVLCGDMNDVHGSMTLSSLLDDPVLRDCALEFQPTYVPDDSTSNSARIDFVLADLRFDVRSYRVIDSEASDHRPVVVDIQPG